MISHALPALRETDLQSEWLAHVADLIGDLHQATEGVADIKAANDRFVRVVMGLPGFLDDRVTKKLESDLDALANRATDRIRKSIAGEEEKIERYRNIELGAAIRSAVDQVLDARLRGLEVKLDRILQALEARP